MRFYIADDDINIIKILANIIEDRDLGEVVKYSTDSEIAVKEIIMENPDIVLVDLLMPKMDGNSLIREIKSIKPRIDFVMVSQVSDSELISEAYNAGIEFFISKPINIIEVEKVISSVSEKVQMEKMLSNIKKIFGDGNGKTEAVKDKVKELKYILSALGMLGEKGTNDILKASIYLMENKKFHEENSFNDLYNYLGDNPKTVKQRIRRSIKNGLTNLAHLGLEDYSGDSFQSYSSTLFDFENVKAEMDYIRGKKRNGGKVSINKFFEGILLLCEKS